MSDGGFCHYCQTRPCRCGPNEAAVGLSDERLAELLRLCEAPSPGPWFVDGVIRHDTAAALVRECQRLRDELAKAAWRPISEAPPRDGIYLVTQEDLDQDDKPIGKRFITTLSYRGGSWRHCPYQRTIAWQPLLAPSESK